MKKPQGRNIIMIDKLNKTSNIIEYCQIELFDKNPLKAGLRRKYIPTAGDRIFIYPDSNIPRFKLKRFCEEHKVSIAKAKDTANVFFMDDATANCENQFYNSDKYAYLMYKDYFLDYVKKVTRVGDLRYIKLIEDLTNSQENVVYIKEHYDLQETGLNGYKLDFIQESEKDRNDNILVANCLEYTQIYFTETEKHKESFADIANKDFYHPDALLALLNKGSVVDKEMYDGIMNLFESQDGNDHKVAMEAMANCDYEKSAVYLLMIFYHHQSKIYNSDTKAHVNFKSYLNFFKLQHGRGINIDDMIDRLKDKRLLNSSNLAILMKEAKKIIQVSVEGETEYFEFTDIAPVEEIQKEVAETDAEEAAAAQPQATIPPTLDSCPGAFQQVSSPQIGVDSAQIVLDL